MAGEVQFWISLAAGVFLLWLGTLSFMIRRHITDDDRAHKDIRTEIENLQKKEVKTLERILDKLDKHDVNQNEFRVEMEHRLTRIETCMRASKGEEK